EAYALIKVLHRTHGLGHFQILANRSEDVGTGEQLFRKLERVAGRFLDDVLEYAGEVPDDTYVRSAVRAQRCVVAAYPSSAAARAFVRLAGKTARWSAGASRGNVEFFIERLLPRSAPQLQAAR